MRKGSITVILKSRKFGTVMIQLGTAQIVCCPAEGLKKSSLSNMIKTKY